MKFIQNRIKVDSSDTAALKIRRKHDEGQGSLHIKETTNGMYEYTPELTEYDLRDVMDTFDCDRDTANEIAKFAEQLKEGLPF